jgi:hypothetical protein
MNEPEPAATDRSGRRLQRSARGLLRLNLSVLGAAFAWFAYVDAPITDGAMRLIAAAVLAGFLSMVAALSCGESKTARISRRWWRIALWSFALMTLLMLTAATVTLNLKGTGNDESYTQTALIRPA